MELLVLHVRPSEHLLAMFNLYLICLLCTFDHIHKECAQYKCLLLLFLLLLLSLLLLLLLLL